jgi:isoleucyl-tRNA synthetase
VYERARATLDEIVKAHPGETIVICSHQNVIELLRKVLYEYDYDTAKSKHKLSNKTLEEYQPFVDYIFTDSLKVLDLHLPYIDAIQLKHPENGKLLKRIPEVLDCRLESASMPYAQVHFPFEHEKEFKESFPADFVVEYMGQVRAWFYVMHVISTLLYDKPAFTHVVTTGTLKGTDGRKMSKSYGNFPDPRDTIEKYGADALRLFLLQTPLPAGNDANFSEDGLQESIKSILLPLWNATSFFITYANIDQRTPKSDAKSSDQQLDQRILAELQNLLARVEHGLQ